MKMERVIFVAALLGSLLLLNIVGQRYFGRLDVTHDRAFTLSDATRETMAALEEPVTITAYFTENLPPPYSSNASYLRDLLEEYRAASKGKVAFEFIDPAEQDKDTKRETKTDIFGRQFREPTALEKELAQTGLQGVEIRVVKNDQAQTTRGYMGLVIKYNEKKEVIPVVKGIDGLEYDLTSIIRKMTRIKMPVIGVLQGHGEPNLNEKLRFLTTSLSQTYEVRPVQLEQGKDRFDATLDALLIVGPKTPLSAVEVKAVDQFLMEGKSVAMFLDVTAIDLKQQAPPQDVNHGLGELLGAYGVTLGDKLIADVSSANINISEQRGFMIVQMPVQYPFLPVVKQLEGESAVSKGLNDVLFPFATEVGIKAPDGVQGLVLARSTAKSWLEPKPFNVDPRRDWRNENPVMSGPYPLMVQLSGKLKSKYASEAVMSGVPGATPVIAESKSDARLIVAGTSTLVQDDFVGQSRSNQALLLNVADWMVLDSAMLAMRTRGMQLAQLKPEISDGTRNLAKLGNALGLPLLLAVVGLVRWQLRESRRKSVKV
jgi:gliding-associated putative ABC transporter substrate-binding component GldG